jgi:hypothetical protein
MMLLMWMFVRVQAFTPMEGVPERMGLLLPPGTVARRLLTTTPGRRLGRAAAADGRLAPPADCAVLASSSAVQQAEAPDQDSPVEGLLHADAAAEQVLGASSSTVFRPSCRTRRTCSCKRWFTYHKRFALLPFGDRMKICP